MQQIVCQNGYAGLGIRLATDKTSIKVAEVFDASPAEKAGIKANDIITHIGNEPVGELTQEQIIRKLRGPAKTTVVLTILREGQDKPLELTATREIVQPQSTQAGSAK